VLGAEWASRVDISAQANELDVEMAQFVEYFQEVANASQHPVERGYEHDVEAMPSSICQQLVEPGAFDFAPEIMSVYSWRNFESALLGKFHGGRATVFQDAGRRSKPYSKVLRASV
jgi:hypothetical protein